ncbi:PREDICTED: glutaredoxin-C9-like [Tarenaya hassleriana]|uniref:glutaredoxin-C9-like n=1 Tax=Tarenaya hassleriana TaxID=28532 RepID=UPI00053CA438|nr:PREDICTED: glutaredoxin-C9-like [Tarenaya hassleriana]
MQAIDEQSAGELRAMAGDYSSTALALTPPPAYEMVRRLAGENAVVVFSMSGCCMCTVVKRLLFGLGVGPTIVELDLLPSSSAAGDVLAVLFHLSGGAGGGGRLPPIPAIFVGGKFLGGVDTLMACHINGSLVPLLKDAGALWL